MSTTTKYRATFGGVALLVTSIGGDRGRDWTVQSPERGDEHVIGDRGRRLRRVEATLLFIPSGPDDDPHARYQEFVRLAEADAPQIFQHPLDGSYLAVVVDLAWRRDTADQIEVTCAFLPASTPKAVQAVGAGVSPVAGPEAVQVAASRADTALAAVDQSSSTTASSVALAQGWSDAEEIDARQVQLELASAAGEIDAAVAALEVSLHPERWEAYKALLLLRYSLTQAAESVTAEVSRLVDYTVGTAAPLRVICARLFGASLAEDRARQVAKLNGIRTPGLVPAGTVLRVPSEANTGR